MGYIKAYFNVTCTGLLWVLYIVYLSIEIPIIYVLSYIKLLVKNPFISVGVLFVIYLILFYLAPLYISPIESSYLDNIYIFIGLGNTSNAVIILSIATLLATLLPTSLRLLFFSYGSQQAASSKNLIIKSPSFIFFFITAVVTIIYGLHLSNFISQEFSKNQLIISQISLSRIKIWFTLLGICLFSAIPMFQDLLRSINLRFRLNYLITKTSNDLANLPFFIFAFQRSMIYSNLHLYIESIYQLLIFAINQNMNNIHNDLYSRWRQKLYNLNSIPVLSFSKRVKSEVLLKKDRDEYEKLFKSILRNHASLIVVLYKNHQFEEAKKGINNFFDLKPSSPELQAIFLEVLFELAVLLYENDYVGFQPMLDRLEKHIAQDTSVKVIYKWLLARAISEDNLTALTTICYSMLNGLNNLEQLSKMELLILRMPEVKSQLGIDLASRIRHSLESNQEIKKTLNKIVTLKEYHLFILLEASLKSIELGNYACTGFITKFLVANYESAILDKVFWDFENHGCLGEMHEKDIIDISFKVNDDIFEYCFNKLVFIIYGHQKYAVKKKLDFGFVPDVFIDISLIECNWLDYLIENIQKASSKYGLSFLEDDDFMESLKDEVYYSMIEK
ncbi:hypothetical protein JNUCC42_16385 [Brevibacterium sp. JNUCC-42]|nr:hypothetical protein JNUCC42_16385 [Brevibacterium sp. JNUCC-42]